MLIIPLNNNIPTKPTTKRPPPLKTSEIPTAEELNKKFPLKEIIEQKAKEIYKEYILPRAKEGYKEVNVPFLGNKTFLLYSTESITNPEYREIFLFTELEKYFNNLGYKTKINKSKPMAIYNNAIKYSGLTIEW